MGRKAKPAHLKLIDGNPGKRPIKEPLALPSGYTTPPGHLSKEARQEWQRVGRTLHAIGVLTKLDRAAFAVYCQAYGRWVQAERALEKMAAKAGADSGQGLIMKTKAGNLIQNPLVGTANKAMEQVLKAASEMGLTPSVRSRIEAGDGRKKEAKHPAAKYFGG